MVVDPYISTCCSVNFCYMYFKAILLGTYRFSVHLILVNCIIAICSYLIFPLSSTEYYN